MTKQQYNLTCLLKYADEHFSMSLESMATIKMELIWLYTHLEIKADEAHRRGRPVSNEYEQSIQTVKRASLFITAYCSKLEQMDSTLSELQRQIEYYKSQQPTVDFSKLRMHYNGERVKYIKDFVK